MKVPEGQASRFKSFVVGFDLHGIQYIPKGPGSQEAAPRFPFPRIASVHGPISPGNLPTLSRYRPTPANGF